MTTDTVTIDMRTNIGGTDGTDTIIDTITIAIMIVIDDSSAPESTFPYPPRRGDGVVWDRLPACLG
jgi:hypothetical protein